MSSLASILLVESDTALRNQLKTTLRSLSCTVTEAFNATEAFQVIDDTRYDLVIVRDQFEDGSGLEIAEYLADTALRSKVVIMYQSGAQLKDRIEAYEAGACDCLTKPIDLSEFKYKIRALLNLQKVLPNQTLDYAAIKLNPDTGTLYLGDSGQTHLRKKEAAILTCLLRHRPRIVTKSMIIDYVWGDTENQPTHSTVDVYIRRIRTHLGSNHNVIKTARGYGYYIG